MAKKAFIIDVGICNGCHNCQIACKDEHCDVAWAPYTAPQPDTGQFWCKVDQTVHGTVPKVNITYMPRIGAQDEALVAYAPDVVYEREDGIVVIDPEKARGRKDLSEKFEGVYWNEELQVPQGCAGCAHLLDDGWEVPRCVDSCATGALRFVDVEEAADELEACEKLSDGAHVYYKNLPKRWVAGQVVDALENEVVIGAKCILRRDGDVVAETTTDEFGDFWFRQVEPLEYKVVVEVEGRDPRTLEADAVEADVNLGRID
ncbi:carboxypeptidase regulatory-like domain-containing protein [Adlercreutzia equolifaciens]|uniref:carboxypeptidase regulatory-like domain-containing protein n=1 Tax=Adlercreutzia equolifaciens TaxID=446660 RepID=UPI003AAA45D9